MNRKWMVGIAAGLLVAAALVIVGAGAYRAGERNATDLEVVGEGESAGRTIVVDGDGWYRDDGFFPGFLVFPLVVTGIVLLIASRRRRWCGPGRYSEGELEEWHRRAHGDESGTDRGRSMMSS
jgi:hypothetical protein